MPTCQSRKSSSASRAQVSRCRPRRSGGSRAGASSRAGGCSGRWPASTGLRSPMKKPSRCVTAPTRPLSRIDWTWLWPCWLASRRRPTNGKRGFGRSRRSYRYSASNQETERLQGDPLLAGQGYEPSSNLLCHGGSPPRCGPMIRAMRPPWGQVNDIATTGRLSRGKTKETTPPMGRVVSVRRVLATAAWFFAIWFVWGLWSPMIVAMPV